MARPGRKSTVDAVKSEIVYNWEYFLKIPFFWKERMEKVEKDYPKSVVYKALKALC